MGSMTLAQLMYGFEGTLALYVFVAGCAGMLLLAGLMLRLSILHMLMGVALMCSAMTPAVTWDKSSYLPTVLLPLQIHRAEFHLATGALLTLTVVLGGKVDLRRGGVQGWYLLAIALYAGFLQFFHDDASTALQTIGFALATIPCVLFASGAVASTYDGAIKILRTIMFVSVLWACGSALEFVKNPQNVLTPQGRFFGILANPQHAAVLTSSFTMMALWLLMNDRVKRLRILWLALVAINLIFLIWTGSRTGALMLIVGLCVVLYRRIGRAVLFLPLIAMMFFGLVYLADELGIYRNLDRLVSVENTREGIITKAIYVLQTNPWIGIGWTESGFSESSYLLGFAAYGILMFAIMVVFLMHSLWLTGRLFFWRGRLEPEARNLADVFCAFNAMYFAGAAFEGFMLGRSAAMQVMLLLFCGIGVNLQNQIRESAHGAEEGLTDDFAGDQHGSYGAPAGAYGQEAA